jgi:hypothetical protein
MGLLQGPLPVSMDHTEFGLLHLGQNCTRTLSHNSKWIGTTSTMTGTMLSAAPTTAPTAALTETATLKWGWNVQRLDRGCINRCWHSMLLICCSCVGRVVHNCWICNVHGWGTVVQRQVLHVQPHRRLISG